MLRFFCLKLFKQHIHRILVSFILFTGFTFIQQIQKGVEIFFFLFPLVPDKRNQCRVQQLLCFHPKIFGSFFPFAFGIHNDCCNQLQDIFFRPYISKWIVMKRFGKIDGIQNLNHIWLMYHFSRFIFHNISILIFLRWSLC